MKVLVKFSLLKDSGSETPFLFWSCVLETSLETVDFGYLNRDNVYKIEDCDLPFHLSVNYDKYSKGTINDIIKDSKKRPEYFVALDKTFLTGSPYKDSSSRVETYYKDSPEFIKQLKEFCGFDSDYKFNLLQRSVIKTIKKLVGVDIIQNESTAGALSIYNRLPAFNVDGQFNPAKGGRYIQISAMDDLSGYENFSVQIEVVDDGKILYNTLQELSFGYRYNLPSELEGFSQFRVSVFGKKSNDSVCEKMYEGKFSLMRSFGVSMSAGGNHSRIVRNRYLNKENKNIDKIDIYERLGNILINPKDFVDTERFYKSSLFGIEKEYLESKYFGKDGRQEFLTWVRGILCSAKIVKIVDPYFDINGFNDFSSCCSTRPQLTIITKNPRKRGKNNRYIKTLLEGIYNAFPNSKVYYGKKYHDRYLYVDDGNEQKLYSFSNSWNGTVNNYSMFIQEVPLDIALQIYDEINQCTTDEKPQSAPITAISKKNKSCGGRKYTKKHNVRHLFQSSIGWASELLSFKYQDSNEDESVCLEIRRYFESLPKLKIDRIIDKTTKKLLENQKKTFDNENLYMDEKPFSWYNTPRKCLKRFLDIDVCPNMDYYRLGLDYVLYELLNICFKIYPDEVIKSLEKYEQIICDKNNAQTDNTEVLKYRVSELIIQSFLTKFYPINGKILEEAWNFIEKTRSLIYIRLFFAISIINEALQIRDKDRQSFENIVESFTTKLLLCPNEIAVVFGSALNIIISRKQFSNNLPNDYQDWITDYIAKNSDTQGAINFSLIAFIEPFEIRHQELIDFINALEVCEKHHVAEEVNKIFLLHALQTNKKLQDKVRTIVKIDKETMDSYFFKKEQLDKEPSDTDVGKYISTLKYLGKIFAQHIENIQDDSADIFNKINFSLSIDKMLIFNTKFPGKLSLFYYDLLFLLNTSFYLKPDNNGRQKILSLTDWYLPICIENRPNDFYGLGLKAIGLYAEMISDDNTKVIALLKKLTYLPIMAIVASTIKEQSSQTIEIYQKYISQYNVDGNDKSIQVENYLNIGISLCMRCVDECNNNIKTDIIDCIEKINEKIKPIITDVVKPILDYGIEYAKIPSEINKIAFANAMKGKYLPHQADKLLEG